MLPLFRRNSHGRSIHALYGAIVAQARRPAFYTTYGVPDTLQGRFDLLVLHLVLLLRRIGSNAEASSQTQSSRRNIGQRLFDRFCCDLDDNLREMGVGDLAVPKRMRRFGEAFYGRQGAYCAALAAADDRELEKTLARNIFEVVGEDGRATRLARYVRAAVEELDAEKESAIIAGNVVFPDPEVVRYAPE